MRLKLLLNKIKNEAVLCIATLLAAVSACIVPPSAQYAGYIDYRVLVLLFSLMLVVSGFRSVGVFEWLMGKLTGVVNNVRQLALTLVLACFFISMWITNDVALITLVPFAIEVLKKVEVQGRLMAYVIVMQTVAANLGSMCTPVGNPQNLYLYTTSGMSIKDFLTTLMPYTFLSLVMIIAACMLIKPKAVKAISVEKVSHYNNIFNNIVYGILFILSVLTVLGVIHYMVLFVVVVATVAIVSPKLFKKVDYMLLLTFVAFFVLVGNIKHIDAVSMWLGTYVKGNEVIVSLISSQFISNVPAAVLLSGFTQDYAALMVGTNIGGLGTIIASMASLISYKFYAGCREYGNAMYMGLFTLVNAVFMVGMIILAWLLGAV